MTSGSQATLRYLQYRQAQCAALTDRDKWITGHVTVPAVSSGPVCCPNWSWQVDHRPLVAAVSSGPVYWPNGSWQVDHRPRYCTCSIVRPSMLP